MIYRKTPKSRKIHLPYCLTKINFEHYIDLCKTDLLKGTSQMVPGTGCKIYFNCTEHPQAFSCPQDYYFNGNGCSNKYICPDPCEDVVQEQTLNYIVSQGRIVVKAAFGRFAIHGSGCKSFVEWVVNESGELKGSTQECPELSYYDPHENRCRIRYYCPEYVQDLTSPRRCAGKSFK